MKTLKKITKFLNNHNETILKGTVAMIACYFVTKFLINLI